MSKRSYLGSALKDPRSTKRSAQQRSEKNDQIIPLKTKQCQIQFLKSAIDGKTITVERKIEESDGKVWFEKTAPDGKVAKCSYWANFLPKDQAADLRDLFIALSKIENGDFHNLMYLPLFVAPGQKKQLQKKHNHRIAFYTSLGKFGKPITYKYAGYTEKGVLEWPKQLWDLRVRIEQFFGIKYNVAFVNVYMDGTGIGAHSDDETGIDQTVGISSISLGRSGRFFLQMKHDPKSTRKTITLEHGSLAMMYPGTQDVAKHGVNKTKSKILRKIPRVNITFRKMKE
jgi:alkylated DNA repair dioxygenase AlkB